jgi:hypothetical protein
MQVPPGEYVQVVDVFVLTPGEERLQRVAVVSDSRIHTFGRLVVEVQVARGTRFDRIEVITIGCHSVSRAHERSREVPENGVAEIVRDSYGFRPNPSDHCTVGSDLQICNNITEISSIQQISLFVNDDDDL